MGAPHGRGREWASPLHAARQGLEGSGLQPRRPQSLPLPRALRSRSRSAGGPSGFRRKGELWCPDMTGTPSAPPPCSRTGAATVCILGSSLCLILGAQGCPLRPFPELGLKILKGLHFLKKKFNWLKRPLRAIPLPQLHSVLSAFLAFCLC